jgi:hypothetical protein
LEGPDVRFDHLRVGVADVAAAAAALEGLGFARVPDGPADWCGVAFAFQHLEFEPAPTARLAGIGLSHRGDRPAANEPAPATRILEGAARLAFAEEDLAVAGLPVRRSRLLTPDALRPPAALRHPNRALGLVGATVIVPDATAAARALAPVLGEAGTTRTDTLLAVHLERVTLLFTAGRDVDLLHADLPFDPEAEVEAQAGPRVAALTIAVGDGDRTAAVLAAHGHDPRRRPDGSLGLAVPALGLALEFRTAA